MCIFFVPTLCYKYVTCLILYLQLNHQSNWRYMLLQTTDFLKLYIFLCHNLLRLRHKNDSLRATRSHVQRVEASSLSSGLNLENMTFYLHLCNPNPSGSAGLSSRVSSNTYASCRLFLQ